MLSLVQSTLNQTSAIPSPLFSISIFLISSITGTLSKCLFLPSLPLTTTFFVTLCRTPVEPAY